MTAGIPGAAAGGLFYLLSALAMPAGELVRAARRRPGPRRWGLALRQFGLASGILAAVWAVGWALGWILKSPSAVDAVLPAAAPHGPANVVHAGTFLLSLATLLLVLGAIQLLRLACRRRDSRWRGAEEERDSEAAG